MLKLLCKIGLHDWFFRDKWEPSIKATVVTRWTFTARCLRCGRTEMHDVHFDGKTGNHITAVDTVHYA